MSFNLTSQQVCAHCSSTGITDNTPVLCTSVLRFKRSVAFSTGHLPGFQVYFLSFCRDKYNWPEEIWLESGDTIIRGTGM